MPHGAIPARAARWHRVPPGSAPRRSGMGVLIRASAKSAARASTMRRCFTAVMLPPAPPREALARWRTSTKTSVPSGSRIIKSTSPPPRPGVLKLRCTSRKPWRCRWASAASSATSPRCLVVAAGPLPGVPGEPCFLENHIVCKHSIPVGRRTRGGRSPALSAGRALHGGHAHRQPGRHRPARPACAVAGGHRGLRRHAPHRRPAARLRPAQTAAGPARAQRGRSRVDRDPGACAKGSAWPTSATPAHRA